MVGRLIQTIYAWLERQHISYTQSLSVIAVAIYLRTFLENFVNTNNSGVLNGFLDTFFHYPLWFLAIFLCVMLILSVVGKIPVTTARTIVTIASFGILIPPVIDFFYKGFSSQTYDFIVGSASEMWHYYISFLFSLPSAGLGIKIEILVAMLMIALSVYWRTKHVMRGVLAGLLLYSTVFFLGALPVVGVVIHDAVTPQHEMPFTKESVTEFYLLQEPALSSLWPRAYIKDERVETGMIGRGAIDHFSLSMSALLLPLVLLLLALLYRKDKPDKWKHILSNLRYTRLVLYLLLAGFGSYLGFMYAGVGPVTLGDGLALLMLAISVLFSCFFLIWENDEEDVRIDAVSNKNRPLAKGAFTPRAWAEIKWTFLAVALVSALLAGWYPFIFIMLFILTYHLYSCPPLRLKRVPIVSSLLIAINALVMVMAGFFLTAGTEVLRFFPLSYALGIITVFFLAENIKNMKDVAGDRAEGIYTLPVLLGDTYGPRVVALLGALAVLFVPVFFGASFVAIVLSVVVALSVYLLIIRKPFSELPVFFVFLLYFLLYFALSFFGLT